jgi:hypothetical protein
LERYWLIAFRISLADVRYLRFYETSLVAMMFVREVDDGRVDAGERPHSLAHPVPHQLPSCCTIPPSGAYERMCLSMEALWTEDLAVCSLFHNIIIPLGLSVVCGNL